GLVTLVLLPAALVHPRRREVWFFVAMLGVALSFTFGWGPLYWLHQASPVVIDFPRTRIVVLAELSLAMLAGFGVDALSAGSAAILAASSTPTRAVLIGAGDSVTHRGGQDGRAPRGQLWVVGAGALVAVGLGAVLLALPDPGPMIDPSRDSFSWPRFIFQGTPFALALLLATILAIIAPLFWQRALPHRGAVLGGLVALDMLTFA